MQLTSKKNKEVVSQALEAKNRFVVMRNGARVSDEEHSLKEEAQLEYDHWNRIITRWPDGSKLEIVNLTKR